MASDDVGGYDTWRRGLIVLFAMAFGGIVGANFLVAGGITYGEWIGGLGGAIVVFLAYAYLRYGR